MRLSLLCKCLSSSLDALISFSGILWVYGISQADMYQMYAYQKKYDAKNVTLLYPKTEQVQAENIEFREIYDDGVIVRVRFVDLFDIQSSLEALQIELLGDE